jgi:MoaA/NifB/PqqE/SkfB family radical SAM enzyme
MDGKMSEELKACPICNSSPQRVDMLYNDEISHKDGVTCSNEKCPLHQPFYLHEWQSRPLEDVLQEQLKEKQTIIDIKEKHIKELKTKLKEARELSIEMWTIDEFVKYKKQLEVAKEWLSLALREDEFNEFLAEIEKEE